ncbi:uncharacterized protein AMSG_02032 [Thecamonas trahens ATCC 50062]|uniref:Oxidation resistance protein 1 n=1 Tax=Thecamonas trahens ATCC 50062 TaxID=461836 RepID=A0A0L0DUW1_THETB|nr:hypothetical protein AMSG_02032 [Thecamonas trahens ATCC 50062]KNC56020.1 hypothetical protein AMSG_02032 [Thecamonas trahens ATCC 50062]|eukprot:XP_013761064.1 hypothetical protein AMSG_02032 [Thecamonas trahens ATCC 50062]
MPLISLAGRWARWSARAAVGTSDAAAIAFKSSSLLSAANAVSLAAILPQAFFASAENEAVLMREDGLDWAPIFSPDSLGYSLLSLRLALREVKSPTLIIIEDDRGWIFGCLTASPWVLSSRPGEFYGSRFAAIFNLWPLGEICPTSPNVPPSRRNIQHLTSSLLAVGGSTDFPGLSLDDALESGTSCPTVVFRSPALAASLDYSVVRLEAWALVQHIDDSTPPLQLDLAATRLIHHDVLSAFDFTFSTVEADSDGSDGFELIDPILVPADAASLVGPSSALDGATQAVLDLADIGSFNRNHFG